MQARRKTRLYIVLAVLAGLGLTVSLTLYALSSNIDLFYTPGEIIYGKTETRALPHTGQRLRVGGYVQPGSLQRDPQTLDVRFKLYDARGVVDVSYKGILPDLFREGQGVVAQGVSQTDASVTRAVLQNLAARRTSVCRMAAAAHCSVVPVDMGIRLYLILSYYFTFFHIKQ